MKRLSLIAMGAIIGMGAYAQKVTVRSSETGKLTGTADMTELVIEGDMDEAPTLNVNKFPNLRHLVYDGNIGYLEGMALRDWPKLETIEFRGVIVSTAGLIFSNCPELRSITFNGPVVDTSRWPCMTDCPKGEYVYINGLVLDWKFKDSKGCPNFKGYKTGGMVLRSENPAVPTVSDKKLRSSKKKEIVSQLKQLGDWTKRSLASENGQRSFILASRYMETFKETMDRYGVSGLYADWKAEGKFADPDRDLSKLDLLKKTTPYTPGAGQKIDFAYAEPSDSILAATRLRFNLDSVAGNGDELSRIKNLLHFVHEAVRHDGGAPYPKVPQTFAALHDYCKAENMGVNCRLMAIMLTEVLLAEGIPARYLTCLPRFYDTDTECHVIAVAWSKDLGKWIWVDPTFDAWVTDENGVMLSPSEVRSRLIAEQPLVLNDYANWNHQNQQTVEYYLKEYMAKNLYIIGCNTINQAAPEGEILHRSQPVKQGKHVYLVPEGITYGWDNTTDPEAFWAAPVQNGK